MKFEYKQGECPKIDGVDIRGIASMKIGANATRNTIELLIDQEVDLAIGADVAVLTMPDGTRIEFTGARKLEG